MNYFMIQPGKAIIIVGATGEGKTSLLRKLIYYHQIHTTRLEVYDVNNEWFPGKPLPDIDEFLIRVFPLKHRVIIFEDATSFFDTRSNDKMLKKMLVGKRHSHNCIILIFHSVRDIPYYIYTKCNYAIVLRTNDDDKLVQGKHPLLFDAYRKVNYESAKAKQLKLPNGLFTPYEIVKLNVRKQ